MDVLWQDGGLVDARNATVSASDRTLLLGVGVFETLRLHGGIAFALDRHVARLHAALSTLGLEPPDGATESALAVAFARVSEANDSPHAIARVTCTAGDGRRRGALLVHLRAVPRSEPPIELGVADFAHDSRSPVAGVKSTSYLVHDVLRRRARRAGRHDDLLVAPDGRVSEATSANLFVVRDGALVTPPPEGLLPGVTRALVLELAGDLGLEWRVAPVCRDDLADVDEAFVTNAATGLLAVDVLDGRRLPAERPVTAALATAHRVRVVRDCGVWGGP